MKSLQTYIVFRERTFSKLTTPFTNEREVCEQNLRAHCRLWLVRGVRNGEWRWHSGSNIVVWF